MDEISTAEGPLAPVMKKLNSWHPGPNPLANAPDEAGRIAGFWLGLWHGFIAPVAFVRSLFRNDVQVYEVHNNGKAYNGAFLLGVTLWVGARAGVMLRADALRRR